MKKTDEISILWMAEQEIPCISMGWSTISTTSAASSAGPGKRNDIIATLVRAMRILGSSWMRCELRVEIASEHAIKSACVNKSGATYLFALLVVVGVRQACFEYFVVVAVVVCILLQLH